MNHNWYGIGFIKILLSNWVNEYSAINSFVKKGFDNGIACNVRNINNPQTDQNKKGRKRVLLLS